MVSLHPDDVKYFFLDRQSVSCETLFYIMEHKPKQPKLNSIEKAIEILLKFQNVTSGRGVRELSQELNFSPATVQRILKTLRSYDFVEQEPKSRHYFLGSVFYRFFNTLHNSNRITGSARQFMEKVAKTTRETVHLNIIERNHRICIDTMESPRTLRACMPIGHRSPLYAGASAKCLLAFSPTDVIKHYLETTNLTQLTNSTIINTKLLKTELFKIKKRGYAESLGERTLGLGSISTPVLNHEGIVQASLSLAIPEIRFSNKEHLKNCIKTLTLASEAFSKAMGYHPGKGESI